MIKTVDNFQAQQTIEKKEIKINENYYFKYSAQKDIKDSIRLNLQDYISKNNSFFKSEDKISTDDLIISISKEDDKYNIQTGNFVGKFRWDGIDIEIDSRFNKSFLKRMLNFADNIFLDDVDVEGKESKDIDISKWIIYYLFIQKLEKASVLGLPKMYQTKKYHEINLKGKIDIKRYIKKDIPFKGKISSKKREILEDQNIIDVLYKAIKIIKQDGFDTKNISNIVSYLKQNKSNKYVSNQVINKALNSKALNNPIYKPYREVLRYAKIIINKLSVDNEDKNSNFSGFIINIAELFEIYIRKLLQKEFSDWLVESPEIKVFEGNFFERKIIPDIVMKKNNKILVFDTKYKRMTFKGRKEYSLGDVDRCDFFQINTYMSYYQNQGYDLIAGGLIYPLEKEYNKEKCFSDSWFGNEKVKFIVDGIEIKDIQNIQNEKFEFLKIIKEKEENFLQRIEKLIN